MRQGTAAEFLYDNVAPTVSIQNPVNYGVVKSLPNLSGAATDTSAGLDRVEVYLRRTTDNLFWTGSTWQADLVWLATVLENPTPGSFGPTAATWRRSVSTVPYVDGVAYQVRIRSWDRAGNSAMSEVTTFRFDTTPPTASVTTPIDGSELSSVSTIAGTATDAVGIHSVQVYLRRESDSLYWNGSCWQSPIAWLAPTVEPTSNSEYGPTALQWQHNVDDVALSSGQYLLRVRTLDKVENIGLSEVFRFTLLPGDNSASVGATCSIYLPLTAVGNVSQKDIGFEEEVAQTSLDTTQDLSDVFLPLISAATSQVEFIQEDNSQESDPAFTLSPQVDCAVGVIAEECEADKTEDTAEQSNSLFLPSIQH